MTPIVVLAIMAVLLLIAWKGLLNSGIARTLAAIAFWCCQIYFLNSLFADSLPMGIPYFLILFGPVVVFIILAGWGAAHKPSAPEISMDNPQVAAMVNEAVDAICIMVQTAGIGYLFNDGSIDRHSKDNWHDDPAVYCDLWYNDYMNTLYFSIKAGRFGEVRNFKFTSCFSDEFLADKRDVMDEFVRRFSRCYAPDKHAHNYRYEAHNKITIKKKFNTPEYRASLKQLMHDELRKHIPDDTLTLRWFSMFYWDYNN